MNQRPDLATATADVAATAGLCALGWATGSSWWWVLSVGWSCVTFRQIRLTRRARAYRHQ
jgi:hypothetical protein